MNQDLLKRQSDGQISSKYYVAGLTTREMALLATVDDCSVQKSVRHILH